MTILVVAAHPDDETLGCGGTIAKLSAENKDVHILILGEGITSRQDIDRVSAENKLSALRENSRKAAMILGAKSIEFQNFPDNMFDSVPLLDIIKTIEVYIKRHAPHTIFTHHGGDLNIDHSLTFRATLTAARPLQDCPVKHIYSFETLSATDWALGKTGPVFEPNLFVDIEQFINFKIRAMQAYVGEIREFPHPRSFEAIKSLAKQRGSMAGLRFCEAFSIIRTINN